MMEEKTGGAPVPEKREILELVRSLKVRLVEGAEDLDRAGLILSGTEAPAAHTADSLGRELVASGGPSLEGLRRELGECRRCGLHESRRQIVFGEGNPSASLVFVGEAPGDQEDRQGRPFVGRAGMLLTRIIQAMKLTRDDVYICNILKCRPPDNRNPQPAEIAACEPVLARQIRAIRPKVICALGTFAARTLLGRDVPITVLRGTFHSYRGIPLMPTYHPAYLLRNPSAKRLVWDDMQMVMALIQESPEADGRHEE